MKTTASLPWVAVLALGGCYIGVTDADTDAATDAAETTGSDPDGDDLSSTDPTDADGSTGQSGGSSDTDGSRTTTTDPTGDSDPSGDATGSEGSDGETTGNDPTDDPSGDSGEPSGGGTIPETQGACPELGGGTIDNPPTVAFPVGTGSRSGLVWYDPSSGGGGPLVFVFHGAGGEPRDAIAMLSSEAIDNILDLGGVVIAPVSDPAASVEWFLVNTGAQNDLVMMDSMVACAAEQANIDPFHIHSMGFSAGGLHTSQASVRRSSYIASVVTYSGGLSLGATPDTNDAAPSALMFHGGGSDNVSGLSFQGASVNYAEYITDRGAYALLCNHNSGHTYPPNETGVWRRADAYNFFLDHPYGVDPLPYAANGIPDWVPSYCVEQ